ncbi:MAG TPA: SLC13 family permease [Anaerolineales bacterium]
MTIEMYIALGILLFAIIFFITEWLRVDVVALIVVIALMISGLLKPSEAIAGFSNPVVLTIAALFVIGGGVLQTGLAATIGNTILKIAGTNPTRLIVTVMLAVALLSAFMSDTGTVAVLLPAVISLAASARISPSKLLIPLSYGALLGGAATLIGTPPNLIVSDILRESGTEPFKFFDYTPIGLLLIAAGVLFMLTIGKRLLPDHVQIQDLQHLPTPEEITRRYQLPDNLFRLRVRQLSPLIDKTIAEGEFGAHFNINIVELRRAPSPRTRLKVGEMRLVWQADKQKTMKPSVETTFQAEDLLIVQGTAADVAHLAASWNLGVQPAEPDDDKSLLNQEVGFAEVLLPPESQLIGKTLTDLRFGSQYHLSVLGIQRPGANEPLSLKTTKLHFGDVLLVQGPWEKIIALKKQRRDFVVMGQPESMLGPANRSKAPIAAVVMVIMLFTMIGEVLPLTTTSMLAGLVMILTGCLTIDEAYGYIDWKSIVLVAGMLPMSIALEKVGLVNLGAESLTNTLGSLGAIWVLGGLFLTTSLFTQVLSNTATAVLIAPLALAAAHNLNAQPHAFLMAVGIAASMAFASPVASPVNTLVMGAGNYRFSDYIKIGVPMLLIGLIISMVALPLLFPF